MRKYGEVSWNNLDSLSVQKMNQMCLNDDASKELAIMSPKGILAITQKSISELYTLYSNQGPRSFDYQGWNPKLSFSLAKQRIISVNFFLYAVSVEAGVPDPRFILFLDEVSMESERMFWISNISPGTGSNISGSVRFRQFFCGEKLLSSGLHTFEIKLKNNNSSGSFRVTSKSQEGSSIAKFWIQDHGADRIWRPDNYV